MGYLTSISFAAQRTLSMSFSNGNSGVCAPITTSPWLRYFSSQARTYGSVRSQFTHVYVQKSTSTTLPLRPAGVSGGELSHSAAPLRDGNAPSSPLTAAAHASCCTTDPRTPNLAAPTAAAAAPKNLRRP